ncbi:MAG: glycosyltransferase [Bacteroidales bacterium]|nr:glycosyltransferase [Bacteroidales bacterium]
MNSGPILSVIIPLHNTEKYIGDCLSSIVDNAVNKTLYEVIVIDDGSTDASTKIVGDYCIHYPNVSCHTQENRGVSAARMRGTALAKGAYIWFIDSDDWIEKDALSKVINYLDDPKDIDILIAPFCLRFPDKQYDFIAPVITEPSFVTGKELLRTRQYIFVGPPYFVFKRHFLEDTWLYFPDHTRFEDEYFSRVLLYRADRIHILTEPLYNYRQNDNSFMHSCDIQAAPYFIEVYGHLKRFVDAEVETNDKSWFYYNITSFLLESIIRNIGQVNTNGFASFRRKSLPFIRREFLKNLSHFPIKEQILGLYLLFFPKSYYKIMKRHNEKKISLA